jgi:hypothetical protein
VSDMPIHQEAPPPATSRRTAWVIVIIMSGLFVLALLGTIWGFVRQAHVLMAVREAQSAAPGAAPSAALSASSGAAAIVTLAPGARIVSANTEAGKLVLHVATSTGGEVEIIDLASGKLTGQVKTAPP